MTFFRRLLGRPAPEHEPEPEPERASLSSARPPRVVHCALRATAGPRRYATLGALVADTGGLGFTPAAFVAQKAKSVSDGVFATLERLSSEGDLRSVGVSAMVEKLAERTAPASAARDYLSAAVAFLRDGTSAGAAAFLANPVRSKPLGFYTWSESLQRIFMRDRWLQQVLTDDAAQAISDVLEADDLLGEAYRAHLARIARLTNALSADVDSLVPRLDRAKQGQARRAPKGEVLVPPSKSVENEFGSVAAFFAKVRAGACDLTPAADSGFYAYQLYALGPLLAPDAAPEGRARTLDGGYAHALERLAGAALFFGRETHVKQLELAPTFAPIAPERWLYPELTLEPVPTFYARTAAAFRFLRAVIEEGWGEAALSSPQTRSSGAIERSIGEGIDDVVEVSEAAALLSTRELEGNADGSEVERARARVRLLAQDEDVTSDARGMVPLGLLPPPEGGLRVLVFAGWELQELDVSLSSVGFRPPGTALGTERHPLPLPIVRELAVSLEALSNREELRRALDG